MESKMIGPNPNHIFPMPGYKNLQFIKPTLTRPNIEVGITRIMTAKTESCSRSRYFTITK